MGVSSGSWNRNILPPKLQTTAMRVVFISATYLSKQFREIPDDVMKDAVFFFGSKRSWVFPSTEEERLESQRQPTDYAAFDPEFIALIEQKEKEGLLCWLKPQCDYKFVSEFFQGLMDPQSGLHYQPLKLDPQWWKNSFDPKKAVFTRHSESIVSNFVNGEHDYNSTMELLIQSNADLSPVLWYSS
eukprot:JP437135.1.p1 GENE.JP437135.1~~JP437135.1.p1  ORF type:complete len:186 (+),score=18.86 JP437135.1:1-558(+)